MLTKTLTINNDMHLVESYATNCGVKIDKPYIYEKFFPLDFEKYVTFSTSLVPSQDYDFWPDVVTILKNKFKEEEIQILQLGEAGCKIPPNIFSVCGMSTKNQEAYLVKNSMLHFGVDNHISQLAGHYNKKIVCAYANNYKEDVKPYWGNEENQILIESDREGNKPSFAAQESPKTINMIKPEKIAKAIFDLLGFDFKFGYKTLESGGNYFNKIIETVPNQVIGSASLNISSIIVRMDYFFDEDNLRGQLEDCVCAVVTNKPINLDLILKHKQKIKEIVYFIEKENDPEFIEFLEHNGIKFLLMSEMEEEDLNSIKLDYIDYGIIHSFKVPDFSKSKKKKNLYFKSSKLTLSNSKMYLSKCHYKNDIPCSSQDDIQKVIDDKDFWDESDYYMLLEKTKTN